MFICVSCQFESCSSSEFERHLRTKHASDDNSDHDKCKTDDSQREVIQSSHSEESQFAEPPNSQFQENVIRKSSRTKRKKSQIYPGEESYMEDVKDESMLIEDHFDEDFVSDENSVSLIQILVDNEQSNNELITKRRKKDGRPPKRLKSEKSTTKTSKDKTFRDKKTWMRKQLTPEQKIAHACDQCPKRFGSRADLRLHISCVHLKLKPHSCDQCNKTFSLRGNLKQHVMLVHLKQKRDAAQVCQVCGKSFASSQTLVNHVNSVHNEVKSFQCEFCGSEFGWRASYKRHIKTVHLQEKNYKCATCGTLFGRKEHLKYHERRHTNNTKPSKDPTLDF